VANERALHVSQKARIVEWVSCCALAQFVGPAKHTTAVSAMPLASISVLRWDFGGRIDVCDFAD